MFELEEIVSYKVYGREFSKKEDALKYSMTLQYRQNLLDRMHLKILKIKDWSMEILVDDCHRILILDGEYVMNKEQIEEVIGNIAKSGYTPERKTYIDKLPLLDYGHCKFTLNRKRGQLVVGVNIQIGYNTGFDQGDVDYLNSITDDWYIYGQCINFSFEPKTEKELEEVMWYSIKSCQ